MSDEAKLREYLRRVTADLRTAHRRLREVESSEREPVAVVAMACRYPGGVSTPDALWQVLTDGVDAVSPMPHNRDWHLDDHFHPDPSHPGTSYTRQGGFLADVVGFDPAFFGISPREALAMDPQQRLLLELAWESLERAGIDAATLRGGRSGVFVGSNPTEYGGALAGAPPAVAGHLLTGTVSSVLSGRLAYTLGWQGPAVSVDTACSTSLVAVHLALQSLRRGECTMALAGGATVLSTPGPFTEMSRQRVLAPDGRCKAFGAAADGMGMAEGAGLVLLEPLSLALDHGHPVLAVIRGSAINSDGASNGLTAPNRYSQQRVIQDALRDASLTPADIDLIEAHGTGTALGDPIEGQALQATYGAGRAPDRPLYLGSLKSNIGHTQAAAGVGGLIKLVLAMGHATMPRTLHADAPTPHVDWDAAPVHLLTQARPWSGDRPRRAAVSAFGISGTNAHVIVEEAPPREAAPETAEPGLPWLVSGAGVDGLRAQAAQLAGQVATEPDLPDATVARTLAAGRTALGDRAAVLGASREERLAGLSALAAGRPDPLVVTGAVTVAGTAFLFSGQGSQRPGMGAGLYQRFPVFAAALDEVCDAFRGHLDRPLRDVMFAAPGSAGSDLLHRTGYTQPALFALHVALHRFVTGLGLRPDHLIGHSIGELSAAHVAGVLDLADACTLVAARARLMDALPAGQGGMVAIEATPAELADALAAEPEVALAAHNAPRSVVVAGPVATLQRIATIWNHRGRRSRQLTVSHAFHSPLMAAILDDFHAVAATLTYRAPELPVVSNLTGRVVTGELTDPRHWTEHIREPVLFHDGIAALAGQTGTFVELGPDATLTAMATATLDEREDALPGRVLVPLLRRDRPEPPVLLRALATAHAHGATLDWRALAGPGPHAALPTYAFQRRPYWLAAGRSGGGDEHPLLDEPVEVAGRDGGEVLRSGRVARTRPAWAADHRIGDRVLLPGTAYADIVLDTAARLDATGVDDLTLHTPLALPETGAVQLQLGCAPADEHGRRSFTVHARPADGTEGWTLHASGALRTTPPTEPPVSWSAGQWPPPGAEPVAVDGLYDRLAERGLGYGPAFRGLRAAWRDGEHLYAELTVPDEVIGHRVHPAVLDAALHLALLAGAGDDPLRLPFHFADLRSPRPAPSVIRARVTLLREDTVAVAVTDTAGEPVLTIGELMLREPGPAGQADPVHELTWTPAALPPAAARTVVEAGAAEAVASAGPGADVVLVRVSAQAGDDVPAQVRASAREVLALIHSWLAADVPVRIRLALATTAAETSPADAAVWGLVRSAQSEHPGRFVLVDSDGAAASEHLLPYALSSGEPQLAVRDGAVLVPRVVRRSPAPGAVTPDVSGTVVITGAGGALGAAVAGHLAERHGAREFLLLSRRGDDDPGIAAVEATLAGHGARTTVVACDVADPDATAAALARAPRPISAVVHAAGVVADATVAALTDEALEEVLRPKVDGAWNLHRLTAHHPVGTFVLFSSVAGVAGNPGQANYAAANAALDALARSRAAAGQPATSVAWGLWEDGMAARLGEAAFARIVRAGLVPMPAGRALALLDAAAGAGAAPIAALFDQAALREQAGAGTLPAVLRGLVPDARPVATPDRAATPGRLTGRDRAEQERGLLDLVRRTAAEVLGLRDPGGITAQAAFRDLGFDSLTAVELRNQLSVATGRRFPAAVVFDHPTPGSLAAYLWTELAGEEPAVATVSPVPAVAVDDDPIVVVGTACRYPGGVRAPEQLWEMVLAGRDGVGGFPDNRGWDVDALFDPDPDRPGHTYTRSGGFLLDADRFDPDFFGVSPREGAAMDPQQRLLLEVAWETLERAGIPAERLRGSATGVFTGIMYSDYGGRLLMRTTPEFEGYVGNGSAPSVASGRIAYTFGFEGPALTIDTACSSSLVAVHLAAQALRNRECDLALAGGATVMATPAVFVEFSRQRGLAADGRCKPFADAADGTGWGEGVGLVLLERLSDARRHGHQVLAVVRGSAVNSDGASNGLTAPNGPSQQRVIRQALANARVAAGEVDVVEAHGTGTMLGDPIEAQALLDTYGAAHTGEHPVWLGAVKSNIGHTQAAAGVAGIIKMIEAMRHGVIPASLHIDRPTRHVDWADSGVRLLDGAVPWPDTGRPRRAAVSAFGISGTNAHLILEQPPVVTEDAEPGGDPADEPAVPVALTLSAVGAPGLAAQAGRLAEHLRERPHLAPADVAWSLRQTRSRLGDRAAVIGRSRDDLLAGLDAVAAGAPSAAVIRSGAEPATGGVTFLFSGQGSQRPGMGAGLYQAVPAFATALDEVCDAFAPHLDRPLRELMFDAPAEVLAETRYTQPALFALQIALFRLYTTLGVRPARLVGHSIGELSAAHAAGVFDLAGAARLVAARGRLMQGMPPGAMAAVDAGPDDVDELLAEVRYDLAAVNGPAATVISGDPDEIRAAVTVLKQAGHRVKLLDVRHAFHSAHTEALAGDLTAVAAGIEARPARIPIHSNLTGEPVTDFAHPGYWARQLRGAVRFGDGVAAAAPDTAVFVELGPDATLTGMTAASPAVAVPSLRRDRPEEETLVRALATLDTHGSGADRPLPLSRGATVDLPTYAFQRRRLWIDPVEPTGPAPGDALPRFRVSWGELPAPAAAYDGSWLVLAPDHGADGWPAAIAGALSDAEVRTVDATTVRPGDLAAMLTGRTVRVVSLLALDPRPRAGHPGLPAGYAATAALVRALTGAEPGVAAYALTAQAVRAVPDDLVTAPLQGLVHGLGRVAALEHPDRWLGLVDLPATPDRTSVATLARTLAGTGPEDQLAVRGDTLLGRRLRPAPSGSPAGRAAWPPPGAVLITGGTGGLGAHTARWLAAHGAARLILVSRRGAAAPGAETLREELTTAGAEVTLAACDVADREQVAALLATLPGDEPLSVVHTAGLSEDRDLTDLDDDHLARMAGAKVSGAVHLHELTRDRTVPAFVLFSSTAGTWGSGGQGAYAAGNAALDALAEHRRSLGLAATAIAWGAWAGEGMAADPATARRLRRRGISGMPPAAAVGALADAVRRDDRTVTVAAVDWSTFLPAFTSRRPSPLLSDLDEAGPAAPADGDSGELSRKLAALPADARDEAVNELVRGEVAAVLGLRAAGEVRSGLAFIDLGFDSLTAVELRNRLTARLGIALPTTAVFDHPSPRALAAYVGGELTGAGVAAGTTAVAQLDGIDAALTAGDLAEPEQRRVVSRMRALLAKWGDGRRDEPDDHEQLESASVDDLLDIIQTEFRQS
ncbi:SDR family NAD(P)-dependent oxidoreductase [Micromonospora sp. NPDC048898]|uniref:SDR family NAD(P)-dependent oxidoreductase n=1 Tax=Micromonospora sp. NPDC048898 TaxID=3364260 RepID=UPI00371A9982